MIDNVQDPKSKLCSSHQLPTSADRKTLAVDFFLEQEVKRAAVWKEKEKGDEMF